MIDYFLLSSIFLSGLLGGVHCVGMCGGIVSALTMNTRQENSQSQSNGLITLCYHLGRISTYTLIGLIVGFIGQSSSHLDQFLPIQQILYLLTQILLIFLGLYIAQWSNLLIYLEKAGGFFWRRIQPLIQKFMPIRDLKSAFILGGLWGFLPCGLVYTALMSAFSSAEPLNGAFMMLAFGLGTLPNLLALHYFGYQLQSFFQKKLFKRIMGSIIICFGIYGLIDVSKVIELFKI